MSRIDIPTLETAPAAAQPLLNAVKAKIGQVPNMYRLISHSPAALEGTLGLSNALGQGALDAATGERIALAVANVNGCDYCNSAHTLIGKSVHKLDDAEIAANRDGRSHDARADAAVRFARDIALNRAEVSEAALNEVRAAGYSDAELVEIVAHVALNTLTNYVNEVFKTEIDFPLAEARRAA